MSTLWTVVIIVVILALIFWLVLSQNKEEDNIGKTEDIKISGSEEKAEDQEKKEGE